MDMLPDALRSLEAYNQFILWALHGTTKHPIKPHTAEVGDAHDPANWVSASEAIKLAKLYGPQYGIGFVFTEEDPFFFIDIDGAWERDAKRWSDLSQEIVSWFPGAAVELSQSSQGVHIIGTGVAPAHRCKNTALHLELYTEKRFCALTGLKIVGDAGTDHTIALHKLVATYFPPDLQEAPSEWTDGPSPDWAGPQNDGELLQRALSVKSANAVFGRGVSFDTLWTGDEDALAQAYPDPSGSRAYDCSSADAALAQHLAFWTGKDCERILRMMRGSALVRDKWDREDYLHRTILGAVSRQANVYVEGSKSSSPLPVDLTGFQYLDAGGQKELFKGFAYVMDVHKILDSRGYLYRPEQFNARYGGHCFQLDDTGSKTTRKAWEAFTESQVVKFPKVDTMVFRPGSAQGEIFNEGGERKVNTYVDIDIPSRPGDVTPFLGHLAKVLPDEKDRGLFLSYMAACVQHKGVKFQWAPVLQGVEGNGKTFFTTCVSLAVGKRYTHFPRASDIDNKFNGWMLDKLLIGVEDIYVPGHKKQMLETLKPMITGKIQEIQAKRVDQIGYEVCCNFMLNSNHKDCIPKTFTDRRFCMFYSAQQTPADLYRDGMTNSYFHRLYEWLNKEGYLYVNNYLMMYPIPDALNPATGCNRAPVTSSTKESLEINAGYVEQEIMEAVEEDRPGFRGGWISSMAVERLMQELSAGRRVPRKMRKQLLQSLGYDWHPVCPRGKAAHSTVVDGGRPRLYVRNGHVAANVGNSTVATAMYEAAQSAACVSAEDVFGG